ncbi:MAG: Glycosyl transferase group 1 [Parcubacteria group bacterium GW2011_GWA2_38_13]|nr:MAG: Glycosyl transferase group 1 [Parcubacteria group bacterium GW2011_GWA2_38_13]
MIVDKSEAFGMVLVEGMACKKPVIASNLAGVRSVVEDGVNGILVEPKNEQELAFALEKILSDDELANTMGEAGLKKVQKRYEWEVVGERLGELFENEFKVKN